MSGISTHVLDTSRGLAAQGVAVTLERQEAAGGWLAITSTKTDADGRVKSLLPAGTPLVVGTYRLGFETGTYFSAAGIKAFFPRVDVVFAVADPTRHYHVPLLLSPFGYSTYRGT
jgi:5-hydroxyisourate hydrolase